MKQVDHDLVIIGGGPAGLTAGLYAARARMDVLLIEKVVPGGQVLITDWVENYPGFPEGISGPELSMKLKQQAERFDLTILNDDVTALDVSGPVKRLQLADASLSAHAVIIATGASPKRTGIPGEDRFYGKGVSFCGTCDGPFFKDKVVAAVGGGDTAVQESLFLTKFVKKVYLIHRRDQLRAAKILQERALANEKIEIVWDHIPISIDGGVNRVEGITIENVKTGNRRNVPVDGCFIWIGIQPNSDFTDDAIKKDAYGFILADAHMQTSVPGVFVAGDGRSTPLRQIVTATGDAAIAAHAAEHYIEQLT